MVALRGIAAKFQSRDDLDRLALQGLMLAVNARIDKADRWNWSTLFGGRQAPAYEGGCLAAGAGAACSPVRIVKVIEIGRSPCISDAHGTLSLSKRHAVRWNKPHHTYEGALGLPLGLEALRP
jgi:hypothetical protein